MCFYSEKQVASQAVQWLRIHLAMQGTLVGLRSRTIPRGAEQLSLGITETEPVL